MLSRVIDLSVRHPVVVVGVWAIVTIVGLLGFARLPLDAFPDTTPVQVHVNTTVPALMPLEVERQLTFPVEQWVSGLPGLVEVRSLSRLGLSQVVAIFDDDTDLARARQAVSERVLSLSLPHGARPTLGPITSGLGEVLHYELRGPRSLEERTRVHELQVRPRLRAVPGVAEVNTWGGERRRLDVVVDDAVLSRLNLSLDDVVRSIGANHVVESGGVAARGGQGSLVRGDGLLTGIDDVERVVVATEDGVPVLLGSVARVENGRAYRSGAATSDGRGETVLGLGFALLGENTRDVARGLRARLDEIARDLPEDLRLVVLLDRAEVVDRVLATVKRNLVEAALLVVAILLLFLGSVRAGLLVALAIPISMACAFEAMRTLGIAGSLMSLGAIDFGLLVDSAVIQIENASRRLSEAGPGADRATVVRDAAVEVRKPTMFGELILLVVYLPVLTLTGVEGKLFRPMATTVVCALAASLVLSVTLMPALARLFLRAREAEREPLASRLAHALYRPILDGVLRHRAAVLVCAVVVLANGAWFAARLGAEFVPRLSEGALAINTIRLASISLEESVRVGTHIERALIERFPDEIEHVWTRTGSGDVATDPMGVEVSDVFVTLTPRDAWTRARDQGALVSAMQDHLAAVPGMRMVFSQPIEMRVNEVTGGVRADVGVKVFGDDLERLVERAMDVERILKSIPGAVDVAVEQVTGAASIDVRVDRAAIARHGIDAHDVTQAVRALEGVHAAEIASGELRTDVVVRFDGALRADREALRRVLVRGRSGVVVPLGEVAEIADTSTPAAVQREWGKRRVLVQCNVVDRDLAGFVGELRGRLDALPLDEGMSVRIAGQFEHLMRATRRLAVIVPLALLLVVLLLFATYRRALDVARVFVGVPFAIVGGVVALTLRDLPFSISAAVGFIALSGVAVLGDMVLVSTLRALLDEGVAFEEAVRRAALRRLRPVLMTALVAGVGFVPMALSQGIGAEVQRPLATVVIGGVISSTFLTLVVLPALLLAFGRREARRA